MKTYNTNILIKTLLVVASLVFAQATFAAGPVFRNHTDPTGALRYADSGRNIGYNPTSVTCGTVVDTSTVVIAAAATWTNIPESSAVLVNNGIVDVTADNVANFLQSELFGGDGKGDGISPVIYDPDGSILRILGFGNTILGAGIPSVFDANGNIIESETIINCSAPQLNDNGGVIFDAPRVPRTGQQLLRTTIHELGHYIGLGHAQVNGSIIHRLGDTTGPGENTFGVLGTDFTLENGEVETMYPFSLVCCPTAYSINRDDVASISFLYPAGTPPKPTGIIRGKVLTPGGRPIAGVNVIARNIDNPIIDAVSAISGDYGNADGVFTLRELTPGAKYAVYINEHVAGAFSVFTTTSFIEEFYNGDNESNDSFDLPQEYVAIEAVAGKVVDNIIIKQNNQIAENEPFVPDGFGTELPLGFEFEFCGQKFTGVHAQRKGMLTFGSTSPTNRRDFVTADATIAAVIPRSGSSLRNFIFGEDSFVRYSTADGVFKIDYVNVLYRNQPSNFSIYLNEDDSFLFVYNDVSVDSMVAGYTCGSSGATGMETEIDLFDSSGSAISLASLIGQSKSVEKSTSITDLDPGSSIGIINGHKKTAVFEVFEGGENVTEQVDLGTNGTTVLYFSPVTGIDDSFEPNDTFETAADLGKIPYVSTDALERLSTIEVGETDFYRFCGIRRNQTLLIDMSSVSAQPELDSFMTLYDDYGNILTTVNDGGKGGNPGLSRIRYFVGRNSSKCMRIKIESIATYGSFFRRAERYFLNIKMVKGQPVFFSEENLYIDGLTNFSVSKEVKLPFHFPFFGRSYSNIYINTFGSITFGRRDTRNVVGVIDLLEGPPRITPLSFSNAHFGSGDFSGGSGVITTTGSAKKFVIRFAEAALGPIGSFFSYKLTLYPSGKYVMEYGDGPISRSSLIGGLVAVLGGREGGGVRPADIDLSNEKKLPASVPTWEFFFGGRFDLQGKKLIFVP